MTAAHALVHVPCPRCGVDRPQRVAREGPLGIVRCLRCSLLYVTPRFAEPQAHYHGERADVLRKYGAILRGEASHNRDPNYEQELGVLRRLKPTGTLLDVGTHCGFFLRKARGMSWTLVGVEPSPIGAALAREFYGLDVRNALLQDAGLADRSADIVTLVDVFEHVDDPRDLLAEVSRVLKDDGLLFVKVPNGRYNLFKYRLIRKLLRLNRVEIFDAKEHVVHYTIETLASTLVEHGFRIRLAFVPLPIQDGAAWKCGLRLVAHGIARLQRAGGLGFGPLATDIAVVAEKLPSTGTLRADAVPAGAAHGGPLEP
ncbi:MAG: class I SAM-dependent methyltransferase [Chloroflexi bacterium]|nr:class I SAM-dependent methyltransferase [Chloroflexota bacterium]